MTTFKELYFYLFGTLTEVLEELERGEVSLATQHLIMIQQEAEDRILEMDIIPDDFLGDYLKKLSKEEIDALTS